MKGQNACLRSFHQDLMLWLEEQNSPSAQSAHEQVRQFLGLNIAEIMLHVDF